jgi:hypothetical protein
MCIRNFFINAMLCTLPFIGRVQAGNPQPLLSNPADYQLVFQDEFEGNALDWNVWASDDAIKTSASGQTVGRWKDNAVVADGLLKLMVYKGNRTDSQWTAGYVWVKELFGPNTYYESRFRVGAATGVNNAFWTAVQTASDMSTRNFKNRYEIDIVEAKVLNASSSITGHLAWHDWKTYSYAGVDIAQGISKTYNTIDFQTWGLWVGEDHFVIYCEGVEQWRGTTHATYTNQWNTGVGKLPVWPTNEEKRAYGKWGQADWSYTGGMNGDDMNICFSNMPWSTSSSTLKDNANNTSMDIDYLRIYKLKSDLNTIPAQVVTAPRSDQSVSITKPIDLNTNTNYYFSFLVDRPYNSDVFVALKSDNKTEMNLKISKNNELYLIDDNGQASTATAYPAASTPESYFESGRKYLIVGRVTASTTAKDIVSIRSFELAKSIPVREPFLYRNIDDTGNTSITNEWHINKKMDGITAINTFIISDETQKSIFSELIFGDTYASVVSPYLNKPKAYVYGQTKSSNERRIFFDLEGKFPFTLTYTDGKQEFTVFNVTQSPHTFLIYPDGISSFTVVSAFDADGTPAIVGGNANFYVSDDDFYTIRPAFDTYLTEGTNTNAHTSSDLFVTSKAGAAQEAYLVFNLPEDIEQSDKVHAVFYLTSKSIAASTKIELLGSSEIIDSNTTWNSAPTADKWTVLGRKVLGTTTGYYVDFDITTFSNELLAKNERTFTLKLRQSIGDENVLTKFKPGHNTTTSVPSFMVVSKNVSSSIDEPILTFIPKVCFQANSRQLINCTPTKITNITLFNVAGQILMQTKTLPYTISDNIKGLVIAHIDTPQQTFIQKLTI